MTITSRKAESLLDTACKQTRVQDDSRYTLSEQSCLTTFIYLGVEHVWMATSASYLSSNDSMITG